MSKGRASEGHMSQKGGCPGGGVVGRARVRRVNAIEPGVVKYLRTQYFILIRGAVRYRHL